MRAPDKTRLSQHDNGGGNRVQPTVTFTIGDHVLHDYKRTRPSKILKLRTCHYHHLIVMSCHVMSCHVMSCHVMSCHVMSCHVMSCHVMSCHVMSCHLIVMLVEFSQNHIFLTLLKCLNIPYPSMFTDICINYYAYAPCGEKNSQKSFRLLKPSENP